MIDTHAHLYYPELDQQLSAVLERAAAAGVDRIIIPSTTPASMVSTVNLSDTHPTLFSAIGVHPSEVEGYTEVDREKMKEFLEGTNSVVSIGEVGLDYYHFENLKNKEEQELVKNKQREILQEMVGWAADYQLPLIIHSREAFADTYQILSKQNQPAVIHCFTGSLEEAKAWLELGFKLSFTGIVTYKKSQALREVIAQIPLTSILLETDAPYLAPEGYRGQVCEPQYLPRIAECIAEVLAVSLQEVDEVTTATAEQFFALS